MSERPPIPVILDVDTGVDDACALLMAARHPGIELRAVTCVGGNASLEQVVANTLTVLDICGRRDVPVAAGAAHPLLADSADARHVHGADGMGDLPLARSRRAPHPAHAVELLRDILTGTIDADDEDRITLVTLGPMTTAALLLRTYPEVARGIRRLIFMGGAAGYGNATASAEFNVFHDPEAGAITLDACADLGVDVTMYGLDVFYEPRISRAQAADLARAEIDTPAGLAGRLMQFQCDRFDADDATIGDAGALACVIEPRLLRTEPRRVAVELGGTWSRGRTIVDGRDWTGDLTHDPHGQAGSPIAVAHGIDGEACAQLWLDSVGALA